MSKINANEKFWKGVIAYLRDNKQIDIALEEDESDDVDVIKDIVSGSLEYIGVVLGENKSKEEETTLEIPEILEATVSYREGASGNWGIGITAGSEIKKKIKGDDELDDDFDDEDEE